jgi:hypothetical protein
MKEIDNCKKSNQIVGNVGLYYVCYELSKRGWNALPTSRNAKGVDVVIYNQKLTETHTIQVKALSEKNPVPFGSNINNLIAKYVIICRKVFDKDKPPEMFIIPSSEVKENIHKVVKDNKISYWLRPKDYEKYKDKWDTIGNGYKKRK